MTSVVVSCLSSAAIAVGAGDAGETLGEDPCEVLDRLRVLQEQLIEGGLVHRQQVRAAIGADRCRALAALQQRHLAEEITLAQGAGLARRRARVPDFELSLEHHKEGVARIADLYDFITFCVRDFTEQRRRRFEFRPREEAEDLNRGKEVEIDHSRQPLF
jgi:hypothetical protein